MKRLVKFVVINDKSFWQAYKLLINKYPNSFKMMYTKTGRERYYISADLYNSIKGENK